MSPYVGPHVSIEMPILGGCPRKGTVCGPAVAALATPARALVSVNGALYLLVDNSGSISTDEWNLQINGYAAAFNSTQINDLITSKGPIAIGLDAFGTRPGVFDIPWKVVTNNSALLGAAGCGDGYCTPAEFGTTIAGFGTGPPNPPTRPTDTGDFTDLSEALITATSNINNPFLNNNTGNPALRLDIRFFKTIDLGMDGFDNVTNQG